MFTKQHYIAIAKLLLTIPSKVGIVKRFADMLEEDNPKFDRERFCKACTYDEPDTYADVLAEDYGSGGDSE